MRPRIAAVLAITAILLAGCADVEFVPYQGSQQNWAVAPGALVDSKYGLPMYRGAPPRPYVVMGMIDVSGARGYTPEASAVEDAVHDARSRGADAVILLDRGADFSGSTTIMPMGYGYTARSHREGHARVIAIKWR